MDADRERYRALFQEREALMEEARVWLEKEGWVRGTPIPEELGKRLDAQDDPKKLERLEAIDREISMLVGRFRMARREGDNLRSRFYALKDKLFAEVMGRQEVYRAMSKGICPLVVELNAAMEALDIDPDDQGCYDRAVGLTERVHSWLVSEGHVSEPLSDAR